MKNIERRSVAQEVRADVEDDRPTIEGYAAVFNSETEIWSGFFEEVAPGAFKNSLRSDDPVALFNHDSSLPLGRKSADTLELREDKTGLNYKIFPPDTQIGRDLQTSIKRGDVKGSSFGFVVVEETMREEKDGTFHRTINEAQLLDVSPVTFPAYNDTSVAVRSLDKFKEEKNSTHEHTPGWEEDSRKRRMELAEKA